MAAAGILHEEFWLRSEGGALLRRWRFHDWRAARDRKVATRPLWRSRWIGLVAVPVSIGLATLVLPVGTSNVDISRRDFNRVAHAAGHLSRDYRRARAAERLVDPESRC